MKARPMEEASAAEVRLREDMQAMLCGCDRRLQAANHEELVEVVIDHLRRDHLELRFGEAGVRAVREIVAARSYRLREVAVYQDDAVVSDEGLIPDPYWLIEGEAT